MVVGFVFGDCSLNVSLFQYLFVVVKLQALDIPVALFQQCCLQR